TTLKRHLHPLYTGSIDFFRDDYLRFHCQPIALPPPKAKLSTR
ncbi:MAG: hypothetical protein ACI9UO_003066, partial [Nitrospinales bacterium]